MLRHSDRINETRYLNFILPCVQIIQLTEENTPYTWSDVDLPPENISETWFRVRNLSIIEMGQIPI